MVWVGVNRGMDAIHSWHDPAGFSILIVCLAGLWLLSLALRRGEVARQEVVSSRRALFSVPIFSFAFLIACLLVGVSGGPKMGTAATYFSADCAGPYGGRVNRPHFRRLPLHLKRKESFATTKAAAPTWKGADSRQWVTYFFRWLPGRTAALFVKNHRPGRALARQWHYDAEGRTAPSRNG